MDVYQLFIYFENIYDSIKIESSREIPTIPAYAPKIKYKV
jgi:hypothetical protein